MGPGLKNIIDEKNLGLTGSKVWKILSGSQDVFTSEIDVSDEENLDYLIPPSQVERRKRSRSSESFWPARPVADLAETTLDFAAGLLGVSNLLGPEKITLGKSVFFSHIRGYPSL